MKVWAIFRIANQYDQPDNDLVQLYANKPKFEQLLELFFSDTELSDIDENSIIAIVGMLKGERVHIYNNEHRLEEIEAI